MKKQGKLVITKIHNYIFSLLYDTDNRLLQINCDGSKATILNNIYIGKVTNILPNINAAFVEFAKGQTRY
jgi:ribonuclease G